MTARHRWLALVLYLAAVYTSLPFARGVTIALGQRHVLGLSVTLLYFASIVGVVYYIVFSVRLSDRVAFMALALLALVTGAMILGLEVPEERIHFLEYGVLALLARGALAAHGRPARQYLGAWALASAAGLGDELIQGLLLLPVQGLAQNGRQVQATQLAQGGQSIQPG